MPDNSTFQDLAKHSNFQVKLVIATGGTVVLVKWIIDDAFLVLVFSLLIHL